MHLAPFIKDIAVILLTASFVTLVFQKIKQPVILGYLVAGIVVGPYTPPFSWVKDIGGIEIWSELGVIFLMFALGLEFNFKKLRATGLTSAVTGPFEALFMLGAGYVTGKLLGYSDINSIFLGAILSISSTTVIIKTVDELKLKSEKFADVIFGILVIEDLVGILLLVCLTTISSNEGFSLIALGKAAGQLILVVSIWIAVGLVVIPRFINYVGKKATDETLVILSLGLCLGLVLASNYFNYSTALGAFVMGSLIAESKESLRIEKLLYPVRDIFGAVFFVSIGMLLKPMDIVNNWKSILVISLVTIFGKVFSTFLGAKMTGQSTKVSIQSGFALAQIGEFSFIIAGLGLALGKMDPALYAMAVSVAVITTFTTPYLIRYANNVLVPKYFSK